MTTKQLCVAYLNALNEGSLEKVLNCFTPDALVLSPLYGERKATDFYAELFGDALVLMEAVEAVDVVVKEPAPLEATLLRIFHAPVSCRSWTITVI